MLFLLDFIDKLVKTRKDLRDWFRLVSLNDSLSINHSLSLNHSLNLHASQSSIYAIMRSPNTLLLV